MHATIQHIEPLEIVDLYTEYSRFDIRVDKEQERLLRADTIIFQFPLFWYSTPSILKEWQDLVLQYGFAYGEGGDKLKGKKLLCAVTTGAPKDAYSSDGYQRYQIREFLRPLEQMAHLCGMHFLPPYVLFDAIAAHNDETILSKHAVGYRDLIEAMIDDRIDEYQLSRHPFIEAHDLPLWEAK